MRRGDEACASSVLGVGSEDILSDVVSPDEACVYALTPLAAGLTTARIAEKRSLLLQLKHKKELAELQQELADAQQQLADALQQKKEA